MTNHTICIFRLSIRIYAYVLTYERRSESKFLNYFDDAINNKSIDLNNDWSNYLFL